MRDERPLPGPEVSNEMHDGGRCYVPHSPDFGQMLQECQSPGLRLVEEVRHVLLSLTWDIDSVLVSFTGDINHVSSDSSDLKHLTGTDHSLVRPQLTEPQSQQNWRSEDLDEITSCRLSRYDLILTYCNLSITANHNEDRTMLCERRKPAESESVSQLSQLLLMIIVFPPRKNYNLSFLH